MCWRRWQRCDGTGMKGGVKWRQTGKDWSQRKLEQGFGIETRFLKAFPQRCMAVVFTGGFFLSVGCLRAADWASGRVWSPVVRPQCDQSPAALQKKKKINKNEAIKFWGVKATPNTKPKNYYLHELDKDSLRFCWRPHGAHGVLPPPQ